MATVNCWRDSDLVVGELVPGLLAVREDLPQHHTEAPHVTLCGEPPVHDALRGHPADRQHRVTAHLQIQSERKEEEEEVSLSPVKLMTFPSSSAYTLY